MCDVYDYVVTLPPTCSMVDGIVASNRSKYHCMPRATVSRSIKVRVKPRVSPRGECCVRARVCMRAYVCMGGCIGLS